MENTAQVHDWFTVCRFGVPVSATLVARQLSKLIACTTYAARPTLHSRNRKSPTPERRAHYFTRFSISFIRRYRSTMARNAFFWASSLG